MISALDTGIVDPGHGRRDRRCRTAQPDRPRRRRGARPQGYGATSLKDVAREASVAPGLLHYYFESKEELLARGGRRDGAPDDRRVEVRGRRRRRPARAHRRRARPRRDALRGATRVLPARPRPVHREPQQPGAAPALRRAVLTPGRRDRDRGAPRARAASRVHARRRRATSPAPSPTAIDGIALSGLVLQQPVAARFHALKVLLLSLVVTAYVTAGQEPPVDPPRGDARPPLLILGPVRSSAAAGSRRWRRSDRAPRRRHGPRSARTCRRIRSPARRGR